MAKKAKNEPKEQPEPNIQFVGKWRKFDHEKGKAVMVRRPAPAFVIDGTERIKLPEGIDKGAYVEPALAARLMTLWPQDFKRPQAK
jgi:hypothetical protein